MVLLHWSPGWNNTLLKVDLIWEPTCNVWHIGLQELFKEGKQDWYHSEELFVFHSQQPSSKLPAYKHSLDAMIKEKNINNR